MSTIRNQITLQVGGKTFLIDAEKHELVSAYKWHLFDNGRGHVYAQTNVRGTSGKQIKVRLHRLIAGCVAGDGSVVDHINGDTTDNRLENIRVVGASVNSINRTRKHGGPMKTKDGWIVRVKAGGVSSYHGFFKSLEAAQVVFNKVIGGAYAR
jgi:hypothetical protein